MELAGVMFSQNLAAEGNLIVDSEFLCDPKEFSIVNMAYKSGLRIAVSDTVSTFSLCHQLIKFDILLSYSNLTSPSFTD